MKFQLKPVISNERIEADSFEMLPKDDAVALSIIVATKYLLRMEELRQTETSEKELASLNYDIPHQKEHILNLWKELKDPQRIQAQAKETNLKELETVRQRLLAELEE